MAVFVPDCNPQTSYFTWVFVNKEKEMMLARKTFPMANLLIQIGRTAAHKSVYPLTEFHIEEGHLKPWHLIFGLSSRKIALALAPSSTYLPSTESSFGPRSSETITNHHD
ncbi:uncharacterized protein EAE98_005811 [Botrytis deweyae]|uniref:Uncharacterized protein n=1 Tax=Botrytis deweyae TaxID=2478750 RepID=A0ABQ7IMT3_9HELO|nr:uncharacterized protein EAE98_005811 [Botrytis deweyae]KAF7928755.1 hypothetical protein EAE98_005811 [Botrytis deweyae]